MLIFIFFKKGDLPPKESMDLAGINNNKYMTYIIIFIITFCSVCVNGAVLLRIFKRQTCHIHNIITKKKKRNGK